MVNETNNKIQNWANYCESALHELLPLMRPIARSSKFNDEQAETLGSLSTACFRCSFSVLALVRNNLLWDADILGRSVVEGSLKFSYLLSNSGGFEERYDEYANKLFDIESISIHEKASTAFKLLPDLGRGISDVILSEDRIKELKALYPKDFRARIQGKWGFTGLIKTLSEQNSPMAQFFPSLLHGFNMSSQHQHMSYSGVCSAMEREFRDPEDYKASHLSHAARLISDQKSFAYLRSYNGYKFIESDITPIKEWYEKHEVISKEFAEAFKSWEDIQYRSL